LGKPKNRNSTLICIREMMIEIQMRRPERDDEVKLFQMGSGSFG